MHRIIRIGLGLICCWVLVGNVAGAEPEPSPSATTKPSAANPVPTPIPLSEIASQGVATAQAVRGIESSLSTDQVTATVEKVLPPLMRDIELRSTEMGKLLAASVPLEFLRNMELVLGRFRDDLSTWNRDLTERIKTLDGQFAQLDSLSKTWKSTQQLPELAQTAPEIPKRMQNLIDRIDRTRRAVESLRERDLGLQGQVLEATAELQTAAATLQQAQTNAVKNLFVQDSPPIWSLGVENWKEGDRTALIFRAS